MLKQYEDIFVKLVKSYQESGFDSTVSELLTKNAVSHKEMSQIISSLCGVSVEYQTMDQYINALKSAIGDSNHASSIVEKVKGCQHTDSCRNENGKTRCQVACPFDAIINNDDHTDVMINHALCIDCGKCIDACTEGNILDKKEYLPLTSLMNQGSNVIAAVAPAIAGQFGEDVSLQQLRTAFKMLGFADMVEVAFFADMLTLKEAVEFNEHVKTNKDILITSCCCPMWIGMLKKVYHQLVKDVSPSVSPMIAAGRVIKKLNPDYKVVFIGPCVAKKPEAKQPDIAGAIDHVLTFEELQTIFKVNNINPQTLGPTPSGEYASREGRLYARTGGVSIAVSEAVDAMFPDKKGSLQALQANGVKECKELLNNVLNGEVNGNFIEGMGCVGGCVGGPKALIPKEEGKRHVDQVANDSAFQISINNACMQSVLREIGIDGVDDFKNHQHIDLFERTF